MNGEFEPANVKVTITKLKEEKRLIRDRYWERPDQFVMTKKNTSETSLMMNMIMKVIIRAGRKGKRFLRRVILQRRMGSGKW